MKKITLAVAATVIMASPVFAGDVGAGKDKAPMCASCHGTAGIAGQPENPNLAGQKVAYLTKQLKDFKSGARKDPTMNAMAQMLTDADIENLSAFYASRK
jgi:cytochrome c553